MNFVVINAITVPDGAGAELEARFGRRAGEVDSQPGFVRFRLLRPADGRSTWYVYTEWESREAFEAWASSPAFQHGHRGQQSSGPVSTSAELFTFEVVDLDTPQG